MVFDDTTIGIVSVIVGIVLLCYLFAREYWP